MFIWADIPGGVDDQRPMSMQNIAKIRITVWDPGPPKEKVAQTSDTITVDIDKNWNASAST
jgi:hypothetical protein